MSQVGISRPATQQSLTARLPEIQHPMSRLGNPEMMGVTGTSRAGSRASLQFDPGNVLRPATQNSNIGLSFGNEAVQYRSPRRSVHSSAGGSGRGSRAMPPPPMGYEIIPEGVEIAHGDPNKPRMPVFGSRQEMASRADSRLSSRMSRPSTQLRLEIDEFEMLIKEKMKTGYYEVKKRFKDNDPEQRGNVSRDAFFRILVTVLNRPLNQSQFYRLCERLGFKDKAVISFTEFHTKFREVDSEEYPKWMDPIQRQNEGKASMSASQVHAQLKEKAKQRVRDIAELIPQSNPDGSGHVLKPEFRNVLNKMGFNMDDTEFEKLWDKYDVEGYGTINGEKMMKKLGVSIEANSGMKTPSSPPPPVHSGLRKKEAERQRSLDIERWLKDKFREGFKSMKAKFERLDGRKTGSVTHADFLDVLEEFGLKLEKPHLAEFLARCTVEPTNKHVPYREFLHRFQDRSEAGMSHNILTNPKHRYNRADSPDNKSTISALETQIMNMFQRDFLSLLGTFHKIDRLGTDRISQEEFRAAIESRFDLEMQDEQFRALVDRVPIDEEGMVKYADFMAQFDTRGKAKSLFSQVPENKPYKSLGPVPHDPTPPPPIMEEDEDQAFEETVDHLVVEQDKENYVTDIEPKRSPQELFKIIKDLLRKDYQGIEEGFIELDELNSRRLSQEMMFHLLKRFHVQPEVTRGEIRDLWKTFITNSDKTLEFSQFTRHFGYSLKSAAYPNAKVIPPRRGDADFMIRSRKLNCAADMLQDNLRSKIDYMWEDLRKEFVGMDPYGTGFVSAEEFREVLSELCVHLSHYELSMLTQKFDMRGDNRVSYIEFLKPFALRKQVWRNGNNMLALLQHPQAEIPMADIVEPPHKGLHGISAKLRQKLSGDWKNLRRAFRKMDQTNAGYLSVPEFRSVLKLANVILDEEEVYQVLSQFDEDMSGRIPYNKFLNETFKPESRDSHSRMLRKSANM